MDILAKINSKNIMVIGDLMVDHYTYGVVRRISPEAPVPVLHVREEKQLPGGAGNVSLNLSALGMQVFALGRVGEDSAGSSCVKALSHNGVNIRGVIKDQTFMTPVKNRMIADTQQIVRVDYERVTPFERDAEAFKIFDELLPKIDAIAISDYAKGFCTEVMLQKIIKRAKERGVPVIVDPKSNHFARYQGATVIKPNLAEAFRAAHMSEESSLEAVASTILHHTFCDYLMITRSQKGISLFSKERARQDFPAFVQEVKDVTGAGDTVCAMVTAVLANGFTIEEAVLLANMAASYVVQKVGCAAVSIDDLRKFIID